MAKVGEFSRAIDSIATHNAAGGESHHLAWLIRFMVTDGGWATSDAEKAARAYARWSPGDKLAGAASR